MLTNPVILGYELLKLVYVIKISYKQWLYTSSRFQPRVNLPVEGVSIPYLSQGLRDTASSRHVRCLAIIIFAY